MNSPIASLFDNIASSYDKLNHLLSANIDKRWRKIALKNYISSDTKNVLDVACGTGDFSVALVSAGAGHVDGVDISNGMLAEGKKKIEAMGLVDRINLAWGDCASLNGEDNFYDAATIAFGLRNFEHRTESIAQLYRVLKPKAWLIVLEFSTPKYFPIKQLYSLYFKHILPCVAGAVSGNREAYEYLPRSVYAFPQGDALLSEFANAGFVNTHFKSLSCGIASIYYAQKL